MFPLHLTSETLFFVGFLIFILIALAIDIGLFAKSPKAVSVKQAIIMSLVWVALSMCFYVFLRHYGQLLHGIHNINDLQRVIASTHQKLTINPANYEQSVQLFRRHISLQYLTGYILEYALSADNIFVMLMIFQSFHVPERYYHKVLVWGIIGALVLRFLFIFIGAALLAKFSFLLYVFGAFLLYTGISMFFGSGDEQPDVKKHVVVRFAKKFFSIYPNFAGGKFFVRKQGKLFITPLFICLLVIEFTDLIFAVDSIPAVFSVTQDPYIVFFSNIFAILGLRSMFFLLSNAAKMFSLLKYGLAIILALIGIKMLLHNYLDRLGITTMHTLILIGVILLGSIVLSLVKNKRTAAS